MYAVEMRGITKQFGDHKVLKGVDLTVAPGEFIAIVGRSGCGKSTLARLLIGLTPADSGTVSFNGQPLDFADAALTDDVLPYNNYPIEVEVGQVFAVEMVRSDTGSSEWFYYRSDGTTWNGLPTTVGFDPEA